MNECLAVCGRDEIGKHRGFKIPWPRALWVRVPLPALNRISDTEEGFGIPCNANHWYLIRI